MGDTQRIEERQSLTPMIPYGRQDVTDADVEKVSAVLRSDFLTQGSKVSEFEKAIAQRVGAEYAIASNSATSSLHLACRALGIQTGDRVWTSPITFVASANCARYCGADVDFVDIDPKSYNISVERLAAKLAASDRRGELPKAIVVVHLAGHPADLEAIHELSRRYRFAIIEDASHAIGSRYRGHAIGGCRYSDITIFSFHAVKIITTGEGGMALTNDAKLAERMALLNSHGITRNPNHMKQTPDGPWYYEQLELGYNYRLTEIQAALGLSQLERLDQYTARRNELAVQYDEMLQGLPLTTPWRDSRDYSAFHLYIIRLQRPNIASSHRAIFDGLRSAGIWVNLHYIPVYRQPDFSGFAHNPAEFAESEKYYSEAITLPLYPLLTNQEQLTVIDTLRGLLK